MGGDGTVYCAIGVQGCFDGDGFTGDWQILKVDPEAVFLPLYGTCSVDQQIGGQHIDKPVF